MANFDFSKLNVSDGRTARLVMHQITLGGATPFFVVRPATEATKGYYNAVLKRAGKSLRQVQAGAINAGMMEENRKDDRKLYPQHIITGWGHIKEDGTEVPGSIPDADGTLTNFSGEVCAQFIAALPTWLFDDMRQFCGNPSNFVGDEETPMDVEAAAKNSD